MSNSNNPIVQQIQGKLTVEQMEQLVQFTDASAFLESLEEFGWTGTTEVEEILLIARQNINLGAKLQAIKYLRELLYETMQASGLLVKATRTLRGADGDTLTLSADLVRSSLKSPARNEDKSDANRPEISSQCPAGEEIDPTGEVAQKIGTHKPPRDDLHRDLFPGIAANPAGGGDVED